MEAQCIYAFSACYQIKINAGSKRESFYYTTAFRDIPNMLIREIRRQGN